VFDLSRKEETMLRLPIYGFARRADDAVARAMAILRNRDDYTAKAMPSALQPSRPKLNSFDD
jgi:hypothetical protein